MPSPSSTPGASSPALKRQWTRFNIIGFTMVLVIIPFCLYYLFFVTSQTAYFSKRNFRVLAGIADNINSKIDNLAINLVNVVKKVECEDKSDAKSDTRTHGGNPPRAAIADAAKVDEAVKLVPDLKFDIDQYEQAKARMERESAGRTAQQISNGAPAGSNKNTSPPASNADAGSQGVASQEHGSAAAKFPAAGPDPLVTLSVRLKRGSFWLYPEYRGASSAFPGILPVRSELRTLFEPIVERFVIDELNETRDRLFDEVLVAEQETGKVIFQRGPPSLTVVTMDSLLNAKGEKLDLKPADQSSSLLNVQIAGTDYKLFLQPVRLTLSSNADVNREGVRWVVCGLTRTDHFRGETFAVSYNVLIIFVFVMLLAMLSWPLLKLKLMGPKDRLRRTDLGLTLFSTLMGTALVTFILLDVHTAFSFENTLDGQLKDLSKKIKNNLQEELGRALDQLKRVNGRIDAERKSQPEVPADAGLRSIDCGTPLWARRTNILSSVVPWESEPYPYFNAVTWTDLTGKQRIKWTTQNETTAPLDVSGRQFFKNAKDGTLWKLSPSDPVIEYYLEPVRSKNTGGNIAVIATREPGSEWVSNLDTKLLSLMGPVLPGGYGFAVIDDDGKVLFHSDEVKNLEEQFFAECENDRQLRTAVISRTDNSIDTNYLGKGHRMYVSALAGTPWTLVTFADKRMARTMNLEVVTLSFVLYILFTLSVVALISFVYLIRTILFSGRYRPKDGDLNSWLWPDSKRALQYELLTVSYVLIAGIFVVAWIIGEWFLVSCCIGLPLLAAGLWWAILRDEEAALAAKDKSLTARVVNAYRRFHIQVVTRLRSNKVIDKVLKSFGRAGLLSYRTRYTIAFAGLLGTLSLLPAWSFFQIASNFEMRLMVKHGQVSIAQAREHRDQRVASQYASAEVGKQKAFLEQRLERSSSSANLDVYDSFFFGPGNVDASLVRLEADAPAGLERLLQVFRPQYNQSCIESQGLAAGASSDGLWRWKRDGKGNILLEKEKVGREGDTSVRLTSSMPSVMAPAGFVSWLRLVFSLALMVVLIYALVRFVARRFFLLDMDLPKCLDFPCAMKLPGSRVLIWSPMTANGNKWRHDEYHVTDLEPVKDWPAWKKKLISNSHKSGRSVMLNHFEHCMDDPAASLEKLLAIEDLVGADIGVVVVSTVDPLSFSFKPKPAAQLAANNGNLGAIPSVSPAIDGKQNGAADLKIEYHSPAPFSVAIEGKQNGSGGVNCEAPAFCVPSEIQSRWTAAFTSLPTTFAADNAAPGYAQTHSGLADILKTKAPWRYIEEIGKALAKQGALPSKDCHDRAAMQELISQVVEQARSYHQSLWDTCSEGQRCTLIQLAQDGMINPKNKHLRLLVKRGLVVCDPPGLRLMDESFRLFVKSVSRQQDVEGWRQQEGGSAWELMRVPLMLILGSVALFLFVTQKDVYESSITFMSGLTGGIAVLFRLLGMFQRKGGNTIENS